MAALASAYCGAAAVLHSSTCSLLRPYTKRGCDPTSSKGLASTAPWLQALPPRFDGYDDFAELQRAVHARVSPALAAYGGHGLCVRTEAKWRVHMHQARAACEPAHASPATPPHPRIHPRGGGTHDGTAAV